MKQEMIDVCNEKNEIIGKATLKEVHEKGLWYRSVGILIFNDKKELLVQTRGQDVILFPGCFEVSASGHVPLGNSYEQGALTELQEEIGINVHLKKIRDFIEITNFSNGLKNRSFSRIFEGEHNGPFTLQKSEVSSVRFMSLKKIDKIIKEKPEKLTPSLKESVKFYLNSKNEVNQ